MPGVIGPELFTMPRVVALPTTVMTGSLLTLFAERAVGLSVSSTDAAPAG